MAERTAPTTYAVVNSGATLSEHVHLGYTKGIAVHVPSLTAVNTLTLVSGWEHAGPFFPVRTADGSAVQAYPIGSGACVLALADRFSSLGHTKFQFATAMTETTTIAVTARV